MSTELPDHMLGTPHHAEAKDLSSYLVHMTTSAASLANIVTTGKVAARNRFGLGRTLNKVATKHESACFTEMPLTELNRLRDRGKSWGIAFKKEFVERQGGQRVWYLGSESSPYVALHEMKEAAFETRDWENPVWNITPFVDNVDPGKYAFDWEREWRVVGGLHFDLEEVVLLIGLEGVEPLFHESFSIGAPLYDPRDQTYVWDGETIPELGTNLEAVLELFHEEYMSPAEAGLSYTSDSESEDGYWWLGCATRYETEDALFDLLPDAPTEVHEVLSEHLNQVSTGWVYRSESYGDEDENDDGDDEITIIGFSVRK